MKIEVIVLIVVSCSALILSIINTIYRIHKTDKFNNNNNYNNRKYSIINHSTFTVPKVKLHQLSENKYDTIDKLTISIEAVTNQIGQPFIQLFTGRIYGYWNNYQGDIMHGIYNTKINQGKIVEMGKNDTQKDNEEIGIIDFTFVADKTINIIAYNMNETKHQYLYATELQSYM